MLHLLLVGSSGVLTAFHLQVQSSWQLSLLGLPPCRGAVAPSSDSSNMYASAEQSAPPPLLMLCYRPTLVSGPLVPLALSGFFDGMLEVFKLGALDCLAFFCPTLLALSASGNPILTHLLLSEFSALHSGRTHSWSGILSPWHLKAGILCGGQHLSWQLLLGVISQCVCPPVCSSLTDGGADFFSPSILSSSTDLFILGDFGCHHPLWDSGSASDPCRGECLTGSSLLTSSSLMTLACLPFLAPGRCFGTWALTICQFFCSFLSSLWPGEHPPSFNF